VVPILSDPGAGARAGTYSQAACRSVYHASAKGSVRRAWTDLLQLGAAAKEAALTLAGTPPGRSHRCYEIPANRVRKAPMCYLQSAPSSTDTNTWAAAEIVRP
jgi:hypothetical protein